MIAGTIVLEDHQIQFIRGPKEFTLTAFDGLGEGLQVQVQCTDEEFGALMALALGSDEIPGAAELYPLAEAVCERLCIRLIP